MQIFSNLSGIWPIFARSCYVPISSNSRQPIRRNFLEEKRRGPLLSGFHRPDAHDADDVPKTWEFRKAETFTYIKTSTATPRLLSYECALAPTRYIQKRSYRYSDRYSDFEFYRNVIYKYMQVIAIREIYKFLGCFVALHASPSFQISRTFCLSHAVIPYTLILYTWVNRGCAPKVARARLEHMICDISNQDAIDEGAIDLSKS